MNREMGSDLSDSWAGALDVYKRILLGPLLTTPHLLPSLLYLHSLALTMSSTPERVSSLPSLQLWSSH